MMKVLFADDNAYALKYLTGLMPDESSGFTLAGTARDGEEAWQLFRSVHPEIVITDIQMPVINGIELAGRILQERPQTVVYFLSSYEEFSYAKSAISIGVTDYLLKHEITRESLLDRLRQAEARIQRGSDNQHYINEGSVRELLLTPDRDTDPRCRDIFSQMKGRFSLCLLVPDTVYPSFRPLVKNAPAPVRFEEFRRFLYADEPSALALLPSEDDGFSVLVLRETEDLSAILYRLCHAYTERFGQTVSIVTVSENLPARGCFADYERIAASLDRKYFFPPSSVLRGDLLLPKTPDSSAFPEPDTAAPVPEKLSAASSSEMWTADRIRRLYPSLILTRNAAGFRRLTDAVLKELLASDGRLFDPVTHEVFRLSGMESGTAFYDADAIFQWVCAQLRTLARIRSVCSCDPSSPAAGRLMVILLNQYPDSSLSVEEIARQVQLSVNQLNHIAKAEYGMTVNKMLTRIRMENAAHLLEGTMPVYEIADRTGYNSISYFSNAFRKYYGCSPQEYRRKEGRPS